MRKFWNILIISVFSLISITTYSQSEFTRILSSGIDDANKLVQAYGSPLLQAMGNNLCQGWYSTAAPLKPWRFEFKLSSTASFAPQNKRYFDIESLELTNTCTADAGNRLPTFFGNKENSFLVYKVWGPDSLYNISYKSQVPIPNISYFPFITPQLTVGLPKGTEIMLRYLPSINVNLIGEEPYTGNTFRTKHSHKVIFK